VTGSSLSPGEDIIRRVAGAFGVTVAELKSKSRYRRVTEPRFAAYWLLRKHRTAAGLQRSYPEIGRMMGGKDHSSVIHGEARAMEIAERCEDYARRLLALDQGRELYGPFLPLDRKGRPPVWKNREVLPDIEAGLEDEDAPAVPEDAIGPTEAEARAATIQQRGSFALLRASMAEGVRGVITASRPAWKGKRWCGQCEAMVTAQETGACRSRFCGAKAAA